MQRSRHPGAALAAVLLVAALTAGCAATSETLPISANGTSTITGSTGSSGSSGTSTSSSRTARPSGPIAKVSATTGVTSRGPSAAARAPGGHGGRGGSFRGSPAAARRSPTAAGSLPAGWPADLPIPAGNITGFTGSAGRWTVLILAGGSAVEVRQSAVALYTAAGFTPVTDSVLNKGNRQITLVAENLDHSATQTNLMIGLTTR